MIHIGLRITPLFFSFYLIIIPTQSISQDIGAIRWLDDNHSLATDTTDWKWHRALKEIKTGKSLSSPVISFGGEVREQFRYYSHLNFGDVPSGANDEDIYLQHRFLLHSDIRVSEFLRFFIQLTSCHANGRNVELHQVDRDDLGVMQAFVDLNFANFRTRLRIGRQEFSYGMERILALRDGPTLRQCFDGANFSTEYGKWRWDILAARPVLYRSGVFDNGRRKNEYVLGTYITIPVFRESVTDIYYFNAGFQNAIFAADTSEDTRNYTGFRIGKQSGPFDYDFEYTYQFGQHGDSRVSAWHISSQAGYRFDGIPLQPKILLRGSIFSGDLKSDDGKINTFRPVSSKPPVYDLTPVGPANIVLWSPEADFILSGKLSVTFRYLNVKRYSAHDGIYTSDMRRMIRTKDASGRNVLTGFACDILYVPNKHVTLLLYGGLFNPGNYVRNTGAGNTLATMSLRVNYKF